MNISIPLWHLILFVLGGVALGALAVLIAVVVTGKPDKRTRPAVPPQATKETSPRPVGARAFLKRCVEQKRSLTVDMVAKLLNVSSRRVRRLLDAGALIAIPTPDGTRRVAAVSVYNFLARTEVVRDIVSPKPVQEKPQGRDSSQTVEEPIPKAVEELVPKSTEEPIPKAVEELVPGPRQSYWYYIEGHDQPFCSVRATLEAMGLPFIYTSWKEIPNDVRLKIRRERI